jgi:thiamine-phosphate pyrophosphorylase
MRAKMFVRAATTSNEEESMYSSQLLAAVATRLNHEAGSAQIPALFFLTDPERTPDPCAVADRLPRGTAVIFRHFGAPNRSRNARKLAAVCRGRGLYFLISADPELANDVGADGVHWPEARLPLRRAEHGLVTASAHTREAVARAAVFGADACVLGPIFPTHSSSRNRPLGLFRASQIAHAASLPVIALGGVNDKTAPRLVGRGFAGLAAVEALA